MSLEHSRKMMHTAEMKLLASRVRRQAAGSAAFHGAALLTAVALCVAFTAVNTPIAKGSARQNVLSATFCVLACATYILFMLVSRLAAFVLSFMEYGYDELELLAADGDELLPANDGGPRDDPLVMHLLAHSAQRGGRRLAVVHREAFIGSMYLGGSGAFLALPALCMWDTAATACFILSLGCIGLVWEHAKVSEFRPNVDTAGALSTLKHLRWMTHVSLFGAVGAVLWLTVKDPPPDEEEEPLAWPMIVFATASPILLRMGCARAEPLHAALMSPSQCLEAGLPVSTLLAILVLCMFSPIDSVVVRAELSSRLALPMLILCPSCLAAIIGFILRGFRHKHSTVTAAVLLCACAIRQQAVDRRLADTGDWLALGAVAQCVVALLTGAWYRHSVVAVDEPHNHAQVVKAAQAPYHNEDEDEDEDYPADSAVLAAVVTP